MMAFSVGFVSFFIILVLLCAIASKSEESDKEFWSVLRNFPIKYRGKVVWHHRAVATVLFAFCKNTDGKWCVLANKRGKGTPDFSGKWNVPCGYLEWYIDGESNCAKEMHEECGITIDERDIRLIGVSTSPLENRQNVTLRYITKLNGTIDDYKTSRDFMEKGEVDEIKWMTIEEIDDYEWAFGHETLIKQVYSNELLN